MMVNFKLDVERSGRGKSLIHGPTPCLEDYTKTTRKVVANGWGSHPQGWKFTWEQYSYTVFIVCILLCVIYTIYDIYSEGSLHNKTYSVSNKCLRVSVYFAVLSEILLCRLPSLYISYILCIRIRRTASGGRLGQTPSAGFHSASFCARYFQRLKMSSNSDTRRKQIKKLHCNSLILIALVTSPGFLRIPSVCMFLNGSFRRCHSWMHVTGDLETCIVGSFFMRMCVDI
jgi:hypothetical protein